MADTVAHRIRSAREVAWERSRVRLRRSKRARRNEGFCTKRGRWAHGKLDASPPPTSPKVHVRQSQDRVCACTPVRVSVRRGQTVDLPRARPRPAPVSSRESTRPCQCAPTGRLARIRIAFAAGQLWCSSATIHPHVGPRAGRRTKRNSLRSGLTRSSS